jgi:hypothetical protein
LTGAVPGGVRPFLFARKVFEIDRVFVIWKAAMKFLM